MVELLPHCHRSGARHGSGWGSPGGPDGRSSVMVPRYSYGQCSIGAASGTVLDVLRTQKLKENEGFYGFTDFRGLRRRGGGADTQQRIKLPPVCTRCTFYAQTAQLLGYPDPQAEALRAFGYLGFLYVPAPTRSLEPSPRRHGKKILKELGCYILPTNTCQPT